MNILSRMARSSVILAFAVISAVSPALGKPVKQRIPVDQEMIDHFRANRQGFARLAEEYKLDGGAIAGTGHQRPEVVRQLAELGLERMVRVYELWFPNPYSPASGERAAAPGAARRFEFHAIKFEYRESLEVPGPRGIIYWKQYVYFPEMPVIKDGRALRAAPLTEKVPGYRVLDNLDLPPKDWERSECLLRAIEPKWFLRLCRS